MRLEPLEKLMLMFEMMGYVQSSENPDHLVFVGDYFTVVRRGGAFIDQVIKTLQLTKPLTEEDIERMQKAKEERAKAIANKEQEQRYKQSLIELTNKDRQEQKEFREMTKATTFDADKFAEEVKQSIVDERPGAKAKTIKVDENSTSDLVTKGDPQDNLS